jgi:hypothetical protein
MLTQQGAAKMQVTYTDLGTVYTFGANTVTFEGEYKYGDVYFNEDWVGEYVRDDAGVCYLESDAADDMRIGVGEDDYAQFAQRLCSMFA